MQTLRVPRSLLLSVLFLTETAIRGNEQARLLVRRRVLQQFATSSHDSSRIDKMVVMEALEAMIKETSVCQ